MQRYLRRDRRRIERDRQTNVQSPLKGRADGDGPFMDSLTVSDLKMPGYWSARRQVSKVAKAAGSQGRATLVLWLKRPQDEEEIFSCGVEPDEVDYRHVRTWLKSFLDRKHLKCVRLDLEVTKKVATGFPDHSYGLVKMTAVVKTSKG